MEIHICLAKENHGHLVNKAKRYGVTANSNQSILKNKQNVTLIVLSRHL